VPLRRAVAFGCAAIIAAFVLQGCAAGLRESRKHPALSDQRFELGKVAVAPFRAGRTFGRSEDRSVVPPDSALVVAKQVAEAIAARGIPVVSPEDIRSAADPAATSSDSLDPARVLAAASDFGANAVLTGTVVRWRDRQGERLGASAPASVGFEVTLLRVPDGAKLWTAVFDETQQPLTENLFNAFRYPGGGSRWLTAEELSGWGADEVATALPLGS